MRHYERRGTEFKVRSGLELIRAKLNLDHGAFYPYLFKCGVYPSTATRRMEVARDFIQWAENSELITREDKEIRRVNEAIGLTEQKPCNLHDFAVSGKLNISKFLSEMPPENNLHKAKPYQSLSERCNGWHHNAILLEDNMRTVAEASYLGWFDIDRQAFKDCLWNIRARFDALIKDIQEIDQIVEKAAQSRSGDGTQLESDGITTKA